MVNISPDSDVITCLQCQTSFSIRENNNNFNNMNYNMNNNNNMNANMNNNYNNNYNNNSNNSNYYSNNNGMNHNNGNVPPKKKKKNTKIFLYVFFALVIIASGIIYYIDYQNRQKEPEIYEQLPSEIIVDDKDKTETPVEGNILKLAPDVDLAAERERYHNNDIIGRLEIPDLFNVLVAKGTDNYFYLSHSVTKEYDIRGTEFIDYRVTPTSKQVNVYGHNTRDINIKVAFLKLEKFLQKDFFDENEYVVFQYDGGKSIYRILAIKEVRQENNEHMAVNKAGADFVNHVQLMTTGEGVFNSRSIPYNENSEIIVLQTCSHHWDNAFYIITAVKI